MTGRNQKRQLYEILTSQLTDASHRTEYLTDKAHSLLGFDGVISSFLVVLVILIVKDLSTRDLLHSSPFFIYINFFVILGISCYILSTIFSLLSFRITKYKRAPAIESTEFIQDVCEGKAMLNVPHLLVQIFDAIEFTDEINRKKYTLLLIATMLLLLAIVCTAILGILVFISM